MLERGLEDMQDLAQFRGSLQTSGKGRGEKESWMVDGAHKASQRTHGNLEPFFFALHYWPYITYLLIFCTT